MTQDNNQHNGVLFDLDTNGVATVTLNRPEKHNAFDDHTIARLSSLFKDIGENPAVRCMVLTANGKNFCAGADINWMQRMADYSVQQNQQDALALATMLQILNSMPKPTIAKVQGIAFGGAVGLIACCDIAIATKLSRFCLSEVKLGLVPATISPYVIEAIGSRAARRYFVTAEVFSARRARRLGLISDTVTEEELDTTISELTDALLKNGPKAIAIAKALIPQVSNKVIDSQLLDFTSSLIAEVRVSDEGQEGLNAFLQKRPASWRQEQ
ncbi:enoyl-CoA hydratase/isomerase family protein [Alteromonadaceae bacterium BrNp21-10]|nr:enoyl-CoA hydratase/isomerase family protein [Alteromonadaceae bacterium BrNp21-10]